MGDHVNKYDPLVEVISERTAELSFTGVVKEIVADTDQILLVNEVVCLIETDQQLKRNLRRVDNVEEKSLRKKRWLRNKYPKT